MLEGHVDKKVIFIITGGATYNRFHSYFDLTTSSHLFNLSLVAEIFCECNPCNDLDGGVFIVSVTLFQNFID